jgi:RNA polymerase sigma factor (sigma-70 family)
MENTQTGGPLQASSLESASARQKDEDPASRTPTEGNNLRLHPIDDEAAPDSHGSVAVPAARGNRYCGPMTCFQVDLSFGTEMFPGPLAEAMGHAPTRLFREVFCEWLFGSPLYKELRADVARIHRGVNDIDVDGVIDEALLDVILHIEDGRPIRSVAGYLVNRCRWRAGDSARVGRRLRRAGPLTKPEELVARDSTDALATLASAVDRERLTKAIGSLPPYSSQVIILYYFEGRNCEEIAVELGKTRGAIKQRLLKARRGLRQALEQERPYE